MLAAGFVPPYHKDSKFYNFVTGGGQRSSGGSPSSTTSSAAVAAAASVAVVAPAPGAVVPSEPEVVELEAGRHTAGSLTYTHALPPPALLLASPASTAHTRPHHRRRGSAATDEDAGSAPGSARNPVLTHLDLELARHSMQQQQHRSPQPGATTGGGGGERVSNGHSRLASR